MAITETQMKAVRITLGNDRRLHQQMTSYANSVAEGIYKMDDIRCTYAGSFGLCMNLAGIINDCCPWASISAFDVPDIVSSYVTELIEKAA